MLKITIVNRYCRVSHTKTVTTTTVNKKHIGHIHTLITDYLKNLHSAF